MGHSNSLHWTHTSHGAPWCPGCGVGPFKITTPKTHVPWSPMVSRVWGWAIQNHNTKDTRAMEPHGDLGGRVFIQNHYNKDTRDMEPYGAQGVGLCHSKSPHQRHTSHGVPWCPGCGADHTQTPSPMEPYGLSFGDTNHKPRPHPDPEPYGALWGRIWRYKPYTQTTPRPRAPWKPVGFHLVTHTMCPDCTEATPTMRPGLGRTALG